MAAFVKHLKKIANLLGSKQESQPLRQSSFFEGSVELPHSLQRVDRNRQVVLVGHLGQVDGVLLFRQE